MAQFIPGETVNVVRSASALIMELLLLTSGNDYVKTSSGSDPVLDGKNAVSLPCLMKIYHPLQ